MGVRDSGWAWERLRQRAGRACAVEHASNHTDTSARCDGCGNGTATAAAHVLAGHCQRFMCHMPQLQALQLML